MWHKFSTQAVAQRAGKSVQRNAPVITKQPRILARHLCLKRDSNPWSWFKTAHVKCAAGGNCGIAGLELSFEVGQGGVIGIAVRYGLDGPGIEFRCGRDFPYPS